MLVKLAWANLFRNRKRNALSLLAVVLGYLGMVCFFDYVFWAEKWMTTISVYLNHNGHVIVYKEGALDKYYSKPRRYLVSAENQDKVIALAKADPRVEYVGRYLKGVGLVNRAGVSTAFMAQGVDLSIEKQLVNHPQVDAWGSEFRRMMYEGDLWGKADVKAPVAVTSKLAKLLGFTFGSTTPGATDLQLVATSFEGALSAQDGNIVSRFSTGLALSEDSAMMTSLETLQRLYDTDGVSSIAIYLKDRDDLRSFYKDFSKKLKADGIPLEALPYYDERVSPFYVGVTQFIYAAAAFFLILVSAVVVISLANTMSMAVVERTREIGTLRSIGYLPQHITKLFIIEGTFLVSIGLVLGWILNHAVSYFVNHHTNLRFAPPGIAGDAQFLVVTNGWVTAFMAAVFLAIGLSAVLSAVRSRSKITVAHLFLGR